MLFQPDREEYVNRTRGLYPWADEAGPVVLSESALIDEVGRWLDAPDAMGRRARPPASPVGGPCCRAR